MPPFLDDDIPPPSFCSTRESITNHGEDSIPSRVWLEWVSRSNFA